MPVSPTQLPPPLPAAASPLFSLFLSGSEGTNLSCAVLWSILVPNGSATDRYQKNKNFELH